MNSTPVSLLERLRIAGEKQAWDRFVELYTPYLYCWARRQGLQESDAADLVQEVFLLLMRKLPEFSYDRQGSFRQWLRTLTLNKWRELRRKKAPALADFDLADVPIDDPRAELEDAEYKQHILRHCLHVMRGQFPASTWQLFDEYVLQEQDPQEIARRRSVTPGTVYAAKSKVLTRLREELDGLVEW
jgi:RNA polymerase sigma-70 factor (ECF subfamily)